jgi:hypothetical protein
MIPGYHDHERLAQTHRQELLREAEHERLVAQLPLPNRSVLLPSPARLLLSLRALCMRLRHGFQRRMA